MSRNSDIAHVYASESRHRLKPHRQRPHRLPVIRRTHDSLTVRLGDLVPRETLEALRAMMGPSVMVH